MKSMFQMFQGPGFVHVFLGHLNRTEASLLLLVTPIPFPV